MAVFMLIIMAISANTQRFSALFLLTVIYLHFRLIICNYFLSSQIHTFFSKVPQISPD
jgi:hypothetical protein